jgi:Beta-lactamase enzyme family
MSAPRTMYRSAKWRRTRRVRAAALTVAVVLLVAAVTAAVYARRDGATTAAGGDAAAGGASPSPAAPAARAARLADVEVRRGETATIRYRVVAAAEATAVTLVVTDAGGQRVKARRLRDAAPVGVWLEATVPVDLPPGRYTYELRLGEGDADAASPSPSTSPAPGSSASAALVVLEPLPPGYPGTKAVAAARDWIAGRDGEAAFAVVDTNGEEAGGYRAHEPFQLASLSKAILLVASLRDDPRPDATTEATLTRMITESDNAAADGIYGQVGARGMRSVARAAGMRDYEQGSGWVDTRASAWDEARFFSGLESLVPAAGRDLARRLLSSVVPIQRWGIPAAAGPEGWTSHFKGGWLGLDNKLMVQAAWLEKGKKRWALAVLSDENPTRSYGWDTQKGVTGLLLGREPTPAYLAVVLE